MRNALTVPRGYLQRFVPAHLKNALCGPTEAVKESKIQINAKKQSEHIAGGACVTNLKRSVYALLQIVPYGHTAWGR